MLGQVALAEDLLLTQFPDVAVLDVPAILAQMRGNAVCAGGFANPRGRDGVRLAESASAIARLAERRDVINVDAEFEHKISATETAAGRREFARRRRNGLAQTNPATAATPGRQPQPSIPPRAKVKMIVSPQVFLCQIRRRLANPIIF